MTDPTDKNEDKSEEGFFMAGFSGATGVPLKQMQDAIAQSTATVSGTFTGSSNISANATTCSKSGNMGIASINVTMAAIGTQSSWCSVGTISIHPAQQTYGVVTDDSGAKSCRILTTGEIDVWRPVAGTQYIGNVSFTL